MRALDARTVATEARRRAGDWLAAAPLARDYLLCAERERRGSEDWAGVLPLGKVAMLAGAGGCGKTMALCQLAVAVAAGVRGAWTGPRWLDTFRVDAPGRVALLTGGEDAHELRRRLWQAARLMKLDADARARVARNLVAVPLTGADVALLLTGADGLTVPTAAAAALRRRLDDGGPWSLVVLDPMSRFEPPGAESDNVTAARFVTECEKLTEAPGGPAVLLSHHTSQAARQASEDAATAARGVTGLTDAVRAVFLLRPVMVAGKLPVPNLAVLTMTKSNYGLFPPALDLVRDREHGGGLRPAVAGSGDYAERDRLEKQAAETLEEATATATAAKVKGRERGKAQARDNGGPVP